MVSKIDDPAQFKEKFREIKDKSNDISMVWCAYYGEPDSLKTYFSDENSMLLDGTKQITRLINTSRIAGENRDPKIGEALYNSHLDWMKEAKDKTKYFCDKTNISEYEVAIGISAGENAGQVMRGCLVINDEFTPKFMVYFDSSVKEDGDKAKGVLRGLLSWFNRERDRTRATQSQTKP